MALQSGVAFQDFSFHPARLTSTAYYPMATASSSSYSPQDPSVSTQDFGILAQHFGQQSIRHDPKNVTNAYHQSTASGPCHQVPQSHAISSPHHTLQSHQSLVCSQPQAHSRLQCQAGHAHHLSSLVENTVATGECLICNTEPTRPQQASSWEDETMDDEFEDEGFQEPAYVASLSYRRSTDFTASGQGYVAKSIRVRKTRRNDP
jgi:hypothetical protein